MLLKERDQCLCLRVETLIREHDFDESEGIVFSLSNFELSLPESPFHEALLVVYLVSLAVLLFGEVEETDDRGLLATAPHETLCHLIRL